VSALSACLVITCVAPRRQVRADTGVREDNPHTIQTVFMTIAMPLRK